MAPMHQCPPFPALSQSLPPSHLVKPIRASTNHGRFLLDRDLVLDKCESIASTYIARQSASGALFGISPFPTASPPPPDLY